MPTVENIMASKAGPAVQSSQAGQPTKQYGKYDLTAANAEDNTLVMRVAKLPAQHRIAGLLLVADDLDSGAALALDVGIEDTIQDPADTTDADAFASGDTVGQAGGTSDLTSKAALDLPAVNYDRYITISVATAAAGGQAGEAGVLLTSYPELGEHFDANNPG